MPYYIVYRGVQRYRNGQVKARIRVRKIRNLPRGAKPRLVKLTKRGGDIFATIRYSAVFTARNGRKYRRPIERDIHLGKGNVESVRITRNPPPGPRVDRRRGRRRRR